MLYNLKQFPSHKPFICPFDKCHQRAKDKAGLTKHIRQTHNKNWGRNNEA